MPALIDLLTFDTEKFALVGVISEVLSDNRYNVLVGNKTIKMTGATEDIDVGSAVVVSKTDYGYHIVSIENKRDETVARVFING